MSYHRFQSFEVSVPDILFLHQRTRLTLYLVSLLMFSQTHCVRTQFLLQGDDQGSQLDYITTGLLKAFCAPSLSAL